MSQPARKLETNSQSTAPMLTLVNDCPRAMSTNVAAYFGKRHNDVMRQLRNIINNCDTEWGLRNFAQSSYTNEQGKEQPCYSMTKDGFTLLAMGFTGPKAMQFKISYIEAFNAMEAELAARGRAGFQLTGGDAPAIDGPSSVKSRKPLANLINTWVGLAPISYRDAWQQVKGHFQIEKAEFLTVAQVKEAIAFVQERIDRLGLSHDLPTPPPPAPKPLLALPEGQSIELPDLEEERKRGQVIKDAMRSFLQLGDPFFEDHKKFCRSLWYAGPIGSPLMNLADGLDVSRTHLMTLNGAAILTSSLVDQVIAGYELVDALQRGQS